jgi:hypothetical protein
MELLDSEMSGQGEGMESSKSDHVVLKSPKLPYV